MSEHFSGISADQLRLLIEKVEHLEAEKAEIAQQVKEIMQEARSGGFDPKILRQVLKLRKLDRNDRAEQEALLDMYLNALGMNQHQVTTESEQ